MYPGEVFRHRTGFVGLNCADEVPCEASFYRPNLAQSFLKIVFAEMPQAGLPSLPDSLRRVSLANCENSDRFFLAPGQSGCRADPALQIG